MAGSFTGTSNLYQPLGYQQICCDYQFYLDAQYSASELRDRLKVVIFDVFRRIDLLELYYEKFPMDFSYVRSFLGPNGLLFDRIRKVESEIPGLFETSMESTGIVEQILMFDASRCQFLRSRYNMMTKTLSLNLFEYYFVHFASSLFRLSATQNFAFGFSSITDRAQNLFAILLDDYLAYYFPITNVVPIATSQQISSPTAMQNGIYTESPSRRSFQSRFGLLNPNVLELLNFNSSVDVSFSSKASWNSNYLAESNANTRDAKAIANALRLVQILLEIWLYVPVKSGTLSPSLHHGVSENIPSTVQNLKLADFAH